MATSILYVQVQLQVLTSSTSTITKYYTSAQSSLGINLYERSHLKTVSLQCSLLRFSSTCKSAQHC